MEEQQRVFAPQEGASEDVGWRVEAAARMHKNARLMLMCVPWYLATMIVLLIVGGLIPDVIAFAFAAVVTLGVAIYFAGRARSLRSE